MKIKFAMVAALLSMTAPAMAHIHNVDRAGGQAYGFENPLLRGGFVVRRSIFPSGLHELVSRSALAHGVPLALAHGVVRVESGYNCGARNRSGAAGIMQVLPRTAAGVGIRGGLLSCSNGLEAGMRYLRQAWLRARGNMCAAASLYNTGLAGSGRCSAYGRRVIGRG